MILFRGHETHSRSFLKAASWRALGSLDTFMLGWLFTGKAGVAGAIAGTEVFTKILLYYFHERIWSSIGWGAKRLPDDPAVDGTTATAAIPGKP